LSEVLAKDDLEFAVGLLCKGGGPQGRIRFGGGRATSGFIPGMNGKGGGGTDTLIWEVKGTFDVSMVNRGLFVMSFSTEAPRVPNLIDAILSYLI